MTVPAVEDCPAAQGFPYRRSVMTEDGTARDPSPPDPAREADESDNTGDGSTRSSTHALSDADIRDALPEDLDAAGYVGPYLFPNNNRRRIPAILYWCVAAACIGLWLATKESSPVLVNIGFVWAAVGLTLVGIYSFAAGWDLDVDERDALVAAVTQVDFPVGHASAQMGWRGVLSRPTWRILLYSAEDPPEQRGLVLIDGVDGAVVEWFVEENPENWDDSTFG